MWAGAGARAEGWWLQAGGLGAGGWIIRLAVFVAGARVAPLRKPRRLHAALGSCGQRSVEAPNRCSHVEPKRSCANRQHAPTKPAVLGAAVLGAAVDRTNPGSCFIQAQRRGLGSCWSLAVDYLISRSAESAFVAAQQSRVYSYEMLSETEIVPGGNLIVHGVGLVKWRCVLFLTGCLCLGGDRCGGSGRRRGRGASRERGGR